MMENIHSSHLIFLLLLTMLTTTTSSSNISSSPPPLPAAMQQLNNVIDALIGAGDFSSWVSILSMSNPTILPVSATLFIPQDNTLDHNPPLDPFLFPYHVIPQRLSFSDLLLLPLHSHLPTLLPGKSISVTDTTASNFSLNNTPLTHPDLFSTASVAVHGLGSILRYSEARLPPSPSPPFMPVGDSIGVGWSTSNGNGDGGACFRLRLTFFLFFFCLIFDKLVFERHDPANFWIQDLWIIIAWCFTKSVFIFFVYCLLAFINY